jgi:TolB protein
VYLWRVRLLGESKEPDGRSIAYETDRTGNGDIYLIGADGHNKVQLRSSTASDTDPSWQPQ